MDKVRNNLKTISLVILIFSIFGIITGVLSFVVQTPAAEDIAGAPENVMGISVMLLAGIGFVIGVPQIYVALKGMSVAKNPSDAKTHITWATILLVFTVLAIISPVAKLFTSGNFLSSLGSVLDLGVEIVLYIAYIKLAKQVRASVE